MINDDGPLIVVGVDGSQLSVEAIRWAAEHARRVDGRLLAVTAYDIPWTIFFAPTATEADYAEVAQEALDRSLVEAPGEQPDVPVVKHLVAHRAAQAWTQAAAGADLLVVGSHGRGELPGMHLGSVANYCVHHAPCPALVFRTARSGR
jgi:nucleotide-binding universal stress UspA family protein